MRIILNLTQHKATTEQLEAGVFELEGEKLQELKELLTFTAKPTPTEIKERAVAIAELAVAEKKTFNVMIGGSTLADEASYRGACQTRHGAPLCIHRERSGGGKAPRWERKENCNF